MERASGTGTGHLGRGIVLAYVSQCGGCFETGKGVAIINWQCCFSQGCRLLIDIYIFDSGWSRDLEDLNLKACVWWMVN